VHPYEISKKKIFLYIVRNCYVGPCHHCMARPPVADGEDGLQIWKAVANVSNE
jgi:hypothetical protein